jgi:hypothetical protein
VRILFVAGVALSTPAEHNTEENKLRLFTSLLNLQVQPRTCFPE